MLVHFILNASFLNKKHNILCIMFRCFRQVGMYHLHLFCFVFDDICYKYHGALHLNNYFQ